MEDELRLQMFPRAQRMHFEKCWGRREFTSSYYKILGIVGREWTRVRRVISQGIALGGLLLIWSPRVRALDPSLDVSQYAHTSWKVREGFSKGEINAIVQTSDGYLWLGTDFGLLRFDGVRAVSWHPPVDQRLPSDNIRSLLAARDGTLWIGTDKGIASWKDGKLTQYRDLAGQYVIRLLEDHEGLIWASGLASPTGRLCAIQNGSVHCYGEDGSLGNGVYGLYEDSNSILWAGVDDGLWRWKPGLPHFYPIPGSVDSIRAFGEDTDGRLLISTGKGIQRFADGKIESYPLPGTAQQFRAHNILRDREGGLWIGTRDRGIVHVHQGRTDVFAQSDGLSGNDVLSVFEDREGNIWVSTLDGLDRFHGFAAATFSVKQGLSGGDAGSVLAPADGSVWFGTSSALDRRNKGQITSYDVREGKINGLAPNSLFQDTHGRIWVSTISGFGYLEGGQFVPIRSLPGGTVHSIAEDTAGNLWIANQEFGLFHLLPGKVVEQIQWSRLGHKDHATALAGDLSGSGLWLGFFNGGVAYIVDGKVQASYSSANGLGEGLVNDLRFDQNGTLWAATEGGLSRLRNGHFATLTSKKGLPCDGVNWMIEDDARSLWLNMPCGLVEIAHSELDAWDDNPEQAIHARIFDSSDGVRSSADAGGYTPRVAKSTDGKLWYTGLDGASVIDPSHIPFNKLPPPVHVEQITADRKSFDATENLRLPPLVRNLEIDYTALSLVAAERVFFRYKLEGIDRDWQDVRTRRQAFYTDLPPGTYHFHVIACNNSGVWNETGDQLDFSVAPAWFQTNLFRVACAAVFLLILWALYQLRLRQLAHQFNITLEARVNERTRIARDLHDTLLQSFQGLMLHFQRARNLLPDRTAEAIETLDRALDGAEEAIVEGRDAIHDLRSPTTAAKSLAEEIAAFGEELVAKDTNTIKPVEFRMVIEGSARTMRPNLHTDIFRIAREALRNAFGHSQGHLIEIEMAYTESLFRLRIRDDGKGIDPGERVRAEQTGHWGLKGMQERAEHLGGKLEVWSEPGAGTEVELRVPASTAYETAVSPSSSWQFWRRTSNR